MPLRLAIIAAFTLVLSQPCAAAQLTAAEAAAVAPLLVEAEVHGLALPGDAALRQRLSDADTAVRAAATAELRTRVVEYAAAQHGGRVLPTRIDARWSYRPAPFDAEASFEEARRQGRLAAWATALAPPHHGYRGLAAARARYAAQIQAGGWAPINLAGVLKAGAEGPEIALLRARLAAEGYESADAASQVFGPSLSAAIEAFQAAHGLAVDGVVGPATLEALNVPAAQRLLQIDLALERWRWLPRRLPGKRLEVNVAAAEAAVIVDESEAMRMRLVVGDLAHKTPLFSSAIHSVVFNPPWNVPASIAANEILPRARRDPGYLARNRFRYVDGQLQQAPGPGNALGRIKLDFDSPFGVYLHDTPGKAAFARTQRTLSHGCMRMEKPRELATLLLSPQGWTADEVEAAIAAGPTRRIGLTAPLPLFVVYQTAWVQADGRVAFRPDVYGWDAKLAAAIRARPAVAAAASSAESECALARLFG